MSTPVTFQEAATRVKLTLSILDVVGRYVTLRRAGRNYLGLCPFHAEKTPSFNVNPERQVYKCFGCGEGGDTLRFLMTIENKTYGELITQMATDMGLTILREGQNPEQAAKEAEVAKTERTILLRMHQVANAYFQQQLANAAPVQAYLSGRALSHAWQQHFGMGYAPEGWENLVAHLRAQVPELRAQPGLLELSGLAGLRREGQGYYDRFRNRLIIPIQDDRGQVVAFGGRALSEADQPKYLNSPETPIYVKSRLLYALPLAKEAIRTHRRVILMEGYFDVMAAHMAGFTHVVGVCGTALTESHVRLLKRFGADTIDLCFDSDEAGQNAILRAIDLIQAHVLEDGLNLRVVSLPGEKDPDDFLKSQGAEAFQTCLDQAQDFLSFKFRHLLSQVPDHHTADGRIQAVRLLAPVLAGIHQPIVRHEHLKQLAEQLHLPEETLLLEVKRLEQKNPPYDSKKNFSEDAIFGLPQRYIRRPNRRGVPDKPRPEDLTAFRQHLSRQIPLADKEQFLLSYLLVNAESYPIAMNACQHLPMQSPMARAFLDAVCATEGTWETVSDLIQALSTRFHQEGASESLAYLAQCAMTAGQIESRHAGAGGDLQSRSDRAKLGREIEDIVDRILALRKQADMAALTRTGRDHEAQADDQQAYHLQLQLREALKDKRSPASALRQASPAVTAQPE